MSHYKDYGKRRVETTVYGKRRVETIWEETSRDYTGRDEARLYGKRRGETLRNMDEALRHLVSDDGRGT